MRVLVLLLVAACSSSRSADKKTQIQSQLKAYVDKLCACDTFSCARSVDLEVGAFVRDNHPLSKPSPSLTSRLKECFNRLAPAGDRVTTDAHKKLVTTAQRLRDEVCACKTLPCGRATLAKWDAWAKTITDADRKVSSEAGEAFRAAKKRFRECLDGLAKLPLRNAVKAMEKLQKALCSCKTKKCVVPLKRKLDALHTKSKKVVPAKRKPNGDYNWDAMAYWSSHQNATNCAAHPDVLN